MGNSSSSYDRGYGEGMVHAVREFFKSLSQFVGYFKNKPEKDIVVPENMEETVRKAKLEIGLDTANFYNFAFVGHSKTGKSSLINAIRGIEDKHPNAAKVGIHEVAHEKFKAYGFDNALQHVRVYDIPGAGPFRHDSSTYYKDKCLCAFDCLIIFTQTTLCREEIDFALQSLRYNQPICFVRSRCDVDLDNEKKMGNIEAVDQNAVSAFIQQMSAFFVEEIKRAGNPELLRVPCFFVSAPSLRNLVTGKKLDVVYQEAALLDYVVTKSKYCRNITS